MPTLRLVAEYGCEACTGPELFSRIRSVAAGARNTFAVLDQSAPNVRVWNLDTGAVTQFGRAGQGPGELDQPIGLALLGDSIAVGQFRGRGGSVGSVELYTSAGAHVGSAPAIQRPFVAISRRYSSSPLGRWTLWVLQSLASQQRILLLRTNVATATSDTIALPPAFMDGSGATATDVSAAISDLGEVALGVGQVAYRLTIISTDGKPRVSGGRELERALRTPEEIALSQQRSDSVLRALYATRGMPAPPSNPPPREIPHFGTGTVISSGPLSFDGRGRLWVATLRGRSLGTTIFDVFSPDLEYLGEVVLGSTALMRHIGANLLVASVLGDFGLHMVRVWRIEES